MWEWVVVVVGLVGGAANEPQTFMGRSIFAPITFFDAY